MNHLHKFYFACFQHEKFSRIINLQWLKKACKQADETFRRLQTCAFRVKKFTFITVFALFIILHQQDSKIHSNLKQGHNFTQTLLWDQWKQNTKQVKIQLPAFSIAELKSNAFHSRHQQFIQKLNETSDCHNSLLSSGDVQKTSVTTGLNIIFSPISLFIKINLEILLLKPL